MFLRVRYKSRVRFSTKAQRKAISVLESAGMSNHPLWLALKAKRLELAKNQNVPPYVVCQDSMLVDILLTRPKNIDEVIRIIGVENPMLASSSDEFLLVLESFTPKNHRQESLVIA